MEWWLTCKRATRVTGNGKFFVQLVSPPITTNRSIVLRCSCDEFKPDGSDNGVKGIVKDGLDFFNDFVGQYELGDIQYLRYTGVNNLKSMYWKHTKNFADGYSAHIKDSRFVFYSDLGLVGMPSQGVVAGACVWSFHLLLLT